MGGELECIGFANEHRLYFKLLIGRNDNLAAIELET